jgi:hypothetical protein
MFYSTFALTVLNHAVVEVVGEFLGCFVFKVYFASTSLREMFRKKIAEWNVYQTYENKYVY